MHAIIAGTGSLPLLAAHTLKTTGIPFCAVSLFPEDNAHELREITQDPSDVIAEPFYKPSKIIKLLKERGVKKLVLLGKVDKRALLRKLSFDMLALKVLGKMASRGDRDIMEGVIQELSEHGFSIISQNELLAPLICPPGLLCGAMSPELENDINVGLAYAEKISACDIGQTVVTKNGMILAVEAIEGTNGCIKRGVELGGGSVVVCKSAHQKQNTKYDLPTLGPESLMGLQAGDVAAIAWRARHTFIVDRKEFTELAKRLGITLVAAE